MRQIARWLGAFGGAAVLLGVAAADDAAKAPPMLGFGSAAAARELADEKSFDGQLSAAEMRGWLQQMASAPNQVGSPHDRANAEFMLAKFKEWGWDAQIETFYVLYPTPKSETLELLAPVPFKPALREPPVDGDRTSDKADGGLPPYNAYGADGDVTAELVYVNYGMQDDYKALERRGISVKGRIVIARYRGGWRGLKPKLAYEHGALGCIIYSDPRDDGYFLGDAYPQGGWRPAQSVQRGSVLDMPVRAGDPLTPGVGATKDARRLALDQAETIGKIPVLPISYADAQPLLAALSGPVAPENWRGALPITYHIGPGPAKVHLAVSSDWSLKPIYDVIAKIPGSESPEQWVVRGNHHDGWVFGAWDPLSGNVALMEEAKAIGALYKSGWRPRRTLVYAGWDAEEPGLLGSTEWAEQHAAELQRKAVLYLNSDTNARGFLVAGGSHSLQRMVNEVASGIADPQTGVSVQARLRAKLRVDGYGAGPGDEAARKIAQQAAAGGDLPLEALGSGSDFTPFLQHLGVASLSLSYDGEDENEGIYHSNYDSFDHFLRFGDPDFAYELAEARTVGHTVLRMADAEVLPMQFGGFADTVGAYVQELHRLADDKRQHAEALGQLLDQNDFALAADPTRRVAPPAREAEVPYLDFAPLDNALARLKKSARRYDEAYAAAGASADGASRASLNDVLRRTEQALTDPHGLPGRDWYRHLIYAPGLYTGYGVKTMPGVREAIEQQRWDEAGRYITATARALDAYCDLVDQATGLLKP